MKKRMFATRLMVSVFFGIVWQKIGAKIARKIIKKTEEQEQEQEQ